MLYMVGVLCAFPEKGSKMKDQSECPQEHIYGVRYTLTRNIHIYTR